MKKIPFVLLVIFAITIIACEDKITETPKVEVLGEGKPLKLQNLEFNEDVLRLYTKVSSVKNLPSVLDKNSNINPFKREELKFKALEIETLGVTIPKYNYGYVLKSKPIDSLVQFHGLYFNNLKTLTNTEKKIIGVTATSEYKDKFQRDSLINVINRIYGIPLLETEPTASFNEATKTWVTKNKIIEINTSHGFSFNANSNGKSENVKYYKLDLLIVDIIELKSLVSAHSHYYNDNLERSDFVRLKKTEFLPNLITIKDYFLGKNFGY